MDQSKAEAIISLMQEMFGDKLADPEVFPRIFEYQFRLANWSYENEGKECNKETQ